MTDSMRIFFIEIQRFNPKNADMHDLLTGWLSFLKDPIFMDKSFLKVKEVKEAMETLKYISANEEMRALVDLRQKTINDMNSELTVVREEGRAEGIAIGEERGIAIGEERGIAIGEERGIAIGEERGITIGEERGIALKARETALSMLKDGLSHETVSKYSGLSIEEVRSLQK
jgi:hypothetical protein